jgi:tRNA G18 (ribose-2'-O)-methylase SpoU
MAYKLSTDLRPRELSFFQSLKGKAGHLEEGIFIAENPKVVQKLLESNAEVPVAYLTQEYFARFQELLQTRGGAETTVIIAPKEEMESIVGYGLHQGVMLAVSIPSTYASNPFVDLDTPCLIVALDSIADAENMGALIRNAAAFGADRLVVDGRCCHPFLRRSVRVSMGTVVDIQIRQVDLLPEFLLAARKRGCRVFGAAIAEHSTPLDNCDLTGSVVLVFGAEGTGLRQVVIDACDALVEIPISASVDSLNVAVANGIFLSRAWDQRKFTEPG